MPRQPRYLLPEHGFFHLTARAVHETALFRTRDECLAFLDLLARAGRRARWRMEALCLMTTHYHLVLEGQRDDVSDALHRVNGRYAQLANERRGRRGHLFGDRFAAWLIESEEHLHTAVAYVLLNPVRAGLAPTPEAWPWSWSRHGKVVE
jgi:putative transposase